MLKYISFTDFKTFFTHKNWSDKCESNHKNTGVLSCCFNVGPASQTVAQQWSSIGRRHQCSGRFTKITAIPWYLSGLYQRRTCVDCLVCGAKWRSLVPGNEACPKPITDLYGHRGGYRVQQVYFPWNTMAAAVSFQTSQRARARHWLIELMPRALSQHWPNVYGTTRLSGVQPNMAMSKLHSGRISLFDLYNAELFLHKPWRSNGFFQFEIIINGLLSSFRVVWIRMGLRPWIFLLLQCGDRL